MNGILMPKMAPIGMLMFLAAAEPVLSPDMTIIQYAVTQGGLLAVVLVLLWSYRRDMTRTFDAKNESIHVLTSLVKESTVTMREHAIAVQQLTKVVDNMAMTQRLQIDRRGSE